MSFKLGTGDVKRYKFFGQDYRLQFLDLNTIPPIEGVFNLELALRRMTVMNSTEEIFSTVRHAAQHLGFESISYAVLFRSAVQGAIILVSSPMTRQVWEYCHAMGLYELDETIVHGVNHRIPGVWHLEGSRMEREQPKMAEQFAPFSRSRIVIPIHGPLDEIGILSFNSSKPAIDEFLGDRLTSVMMELQYLVLHAHEHICRVSLWDWRVRDEQGMSITLTNKEKDILTYLAKGNTVQQVAPLIGVVEATVNYHIKKLKAKLHTETIGETLAKAIDFGITSPRASYTKVEQVNLSPYEYKPTVSKDGEAR